MIILSYLHLLEKLAIVIFILSYLALNPELSYLIRTIFLIILPNSADYNVTPILRFRRCYCSQCQTLNQTNLTFPVIKIDFH